MGEIESPPNSAVTGQPNAGPDVIVLGREGTATGATPVARAVRWYLASRPAAGGVRYAVYVDGTLITSDHPTGEAALAEAERIVGAGAAGAPDATPAPDAL